MNILHLYKDYYPVLGGIENHLKVLAESQVVAGHQVSVLVCDPGFRTRTEILNDVTIVKVGRLTTKASMPISFRKPALLARQRPDIVHIHSPYPLGEMANWLLGRAKKTVITHHSDVVRQKTILHLYGPFLRRVLQAANKVIATSPRYIASSPWLNLVRDKCVVVPLGVDTNRFSPPEQPQGKPFTLLFVGRLRYYKGLDTLLYALPQMPDVNLVIVGEGPMQQEWQLLSQQLGVADRITFEGAVDDAELPGYYRRANLFVLPANARSEAFGTVLLEAMASGLPCITTELGTGTSWIVQDGVTGFVVPPKDPLALAEAINKLVADELLCQQFARAGLKRVNSEFTEAIMVKRIMALYEEILEP